MSNIGVVIIAGPIGFAGNELVGPVPLVGRRRSAALVADGYHARTDGPTLAVAPWASRLASHSPTDRRAPHQRRDPDRAQAGRGLMLV
ncbi:MAG: hypothetical protein R3C32_02050 [Chloroflexota bacterium]